ncbi:MAG: DUF418 domain-containing protein [Armatimonadetes bacterium]|nr:DUF418 domain-containing protein [Armatimonadota bacterium]MDW8121613.1 DUF418 domain-containing protein [Armatimonadota bacterium]
MEPTDRSTISVSEQERLPVLDLLRGVAILMILPANLPLFSFTDPLFHEKKLIGLDKVLYGLTLFLIYGKFITLLSILFGAGLAIQAERAEAKGVPFRSYYIRRLGVLLLLGLIHGIVFWYGDVLALYALVGIIAMLLTPLDQRALLRLVKVLLAWCYFCLLLIFVSVLLAQWANRTFQQFPQQTKVSAPLPSSPKGEPRAPEVKETERRREQQRKAAEEFGRKIGEYFSVRNQIRIYREGGWKEKVLNNLLFFSGMICCFVPWLIGPYVLACFLFGMYLYRLRGFADIAAHQSFFTKWQKIGFGVGIPVHIVSLALLFLTSSVAVPNLFVGFGAFFQSVAYLATLALWSRQNFCPWLLERLRAVGRLALTNYLLQTLICTFIFYGNGLGLAGQWSLTQVFSLVPVMWLFHLLISPVWLGHFSIGPVEWLWRSLSEGRRRPFLRRS